MQFQNRLQSQIDLASRCVPDFTWMNRVSDRFSEAYRLSNQLTASGIFDTIREQQSLWDKSANQFLEAYRFSNQLATSGVFSMIQEQQSLWDQVSSQFSEIYRVSNQLAKSGIFNMIQEQRSLWDQVSSHYESLRESIEQATAITSQLPDNLLTTAIPVPSYGTISSALHAAEPYIPTENRAIYEDECEKVKEAAPIQKLSVDTIIGLFSLLLAALSFVLSLMPDSQLEELARQNEQLITLESQQLAEIQEQNALLEEQNRLLQERADSSQALNDTAVSILEGLQVLSQELQAFCEESEDLSDGPHPDPQQENSDSQNTDSDR